MAVQIHLDWRSIITLFLPSGEATYLKENMIQGWRSPLKWHKVINAGRNHSVVLHSWTSEGHFQPLVTVSFAAHLKKGRPRLPSKKGTVFQCSGFRWVSKPSNRKSNHESCPTSLLCRFLSHHLSTGPSRVSKVWRLVTVTSHFSGPF